MSVIVKRAGLVKIVLMISKNVIVTHTIVMLMPLVWKIRPDLNASVQLGFSEMDRFVRHVVSDFIKMLPTNQIVLRVKIVVLVLYSKVAAETIPANV